MPESIWYDANPVRRSSLLSLSYTLSYSAEAVKLLTLAVNSSGLTCPTFCLFNVVKYNKLFVYKTHGVIIKNISVDVKTFIYPLCPDVLKVFLPPLEICLEKK